jgi:hypothetical protein
MHLFIINIEVKMNLLAKLKPFKSTLKLNTAAIRVFSAEATPAAP